jgi:hypothetical protein
MKLDPSSLTNESISNYTGFTYMMLGLSVTAEPYVPHVCDEEVIQ